MLRTLLLGFAACLLPSLAAAGAPAPLLVEVDHAKVVKIGRPAATIIIGNPAIVDVTVHDARTLVLTGRTFGVTNLIILDGDGEAVMDEAVEVKAFEGGTVRIYRQASRETYACAPECGPTVTVGDDPSAFGVAAAQFGKRQEMATGAEK